MSQSEKVDEDYFAVDYLQFSKSGKFVFIEALCGLLTWPVVLPLVLIAKLSEVAFRTVSEALSFVPYVFGVIIRYEFYRFALRSVGKNVQIEYGVIFIHPDVSIGSNVLIGRYSIVHHCDIGNYVLIGERCSFLSGSKQHNYDRIDVPMALQSGKKKRIRIEDDCWIGSHALLMDSVGTGSIVAAAAVVTKPVETKTIVAGNPAREVGRRDAG